MALVLATASSLAASPGKQFAQPLNFVADPPSDFVANRLLSDRSRDVRQTFRGHLRELRQLKRLPQAVGSRFEQGALPNSIPALDGIDLIYADPPYTGDEYSRFYHVLNIIAAGTPFSLTMVHGAPTKGRYPTSRSKSAFCQRGAAVNAFRELAGAVGKRDTKFVLSYSAQQAPGSRARTVSLGVLREICESEFSSVMVVPLDHSYRPLQPKDRKAPSATEFVLVCE